MLVEEIMQREVKVLQHTDTVRHAAEVMRDADLGFLPIKSSEGQIVGTLTDRDIVVRVLAEGKSVDGAVSDVMSIDLVSCGPKDDLHKAENLLGEHHVSRILCLDDNKQILGVVALADLARAEDSDAVGHTMHEIKASSVATSPLM